MFQSAVTALAILKYRYFFLFVPKAQWRIKAQISFVKQPFTKQWNMYGSHFSVWINSLRHNNNILQIEIVKSLRVVE